MTVSFSINTLFHGFNYQFHLLRYDRSFYQVILLCPWFNSSCIPVTSHCLFRLEGAMLLFPVYILAFANVYKLQSPQASNVNIPLAGCEFRSFKHNAAQACIVILGDMEVTWLRLRFNSVRCEHLELTLNPGSFFMCSCDCASTQKRVPSSIKTRVNTWVYPKFSGLNR
jgi:hypothetical protein